MQIRFREYNKEKDKYDLVGYTDVTDYDTAFKMLTFMREHECSFCIEVNPTGIVETEGDYYCVKNVSYCIPALGKELISHIIVDIEREA